MKGKSSYATMAKAIGAENVNGVAGKNASAGTYVFKALGEKSQVRGTKVSWLPVYLENTETGELVRFSAKTLISAKGLKYPSAIGAERLASIDQACESNLQVEFEGGDLIKVKSTAKEGQEGYFAPYERFVPEFTAVEMPKPEYAEE